MIQTDKPTIDVQQQPKHKLISNQVTNHLANERTFLAWIRTGLATITFGFVVARFGLFLRELGLKSKPIPFFSLHYSMIFGVALTFLGIVAIIIALTNFLHTRHDIDNNQFHPPASFAILVTALASLIGILLAVYLVLTS